MHEPSMADRVSGRFAPEPGRAPELTVPEDLFLTPRVVNRQTFEAYARQLGELIDEARARTRELAEAAGEIRSLGDSARSGAGDLRASVEAALSVVPRLDERVADAQRALDAAQDGAELARQIETRVGATLDERLAAFEQRVGAIVERAQQRLDEVSGARLERAEALANRLETDLNECERRSLAIEQGLTDRVGAVQQRIDETLAGATQRVGDLDQAMRAATDRLDEHLATSEQRVAERIEQLKADLGRVATPTMQSLGVLTRAAGEIIGRDPRTPADKAPPPRAGSLADLVARGEAVAEVLAQVAACEPIDAACGAVPIADEDAAEPAPADELPVVRVVPGVGLAAPRSGPKLPAPAGFRRVDRPSP